MAWLIGICFVILAITFWRIFLPLGVIVTLLALFLTLKANAASCLEIH